MTGLPAQAARIRLGVSRCLLGDPVRWDGGHKHDHFLTDVLGPYVEYVPVCPEVEAGFGIPREPFRLIGDWGAPRLVTNRTGVDHTDRMQTWAAQRLEELAGEALMGFVFKKDSPSSGMERVKVYDRNGVPMKRGVGIFARAFMERFPDIPVEEEGRLNDTRLRENFIERIFTLDRWREVAERPSRMGLVQFHTAHKLLLLSHSPEHYREMGRLVADLRGRPLDEVFGAYRGMLTDALRLHATNRKQRNVLQHAMGYFKKVLSPDEKRELLEVLEAYGREDVPLIVPVTLIDHYVRKYDEPYLKGQVYLRPHPLELRLRNHA